MYFSSLLFSHEMFILSDSFTLPIHNIVELYAAKIIKMFNGLPVQQIVNNRRIYMVKTFLTFREKKEMLYERINIDVNPLEKFIIYLRLLTIIFRL
jgi:hypothetical protein